MGSASDIPGSGHSSFATNLNAWLEGLEASPTECLFRVLKPFSLELVEFNP